MNLNIETTTQDKFYEVKVGGELDVYTVPEFRRGFNTYETRWNS